MEGIGSENTRSDEIAREITRRLPADARPMVADLIAAVRMETAREAAAMLREELDALRADAGALSSRRTKDQNEIRYRYLQEIAAEMQRLAIDGKAPTKQRWDDERSDRFPRAARLIMEFGRWSGIVKSAGLLPPHAQPKRAG